MANNEQATETVEVEIDDEVYHELKRQADAQDMTVVEYLQFLITE